ncbi:hypothetical protein PCE1_002196 [Barthelona sp. PCE]
MATQDPRAAIGDFLNQSKPKELPTTHEQMQLTNTLSGSQQATLRVGKSSFEEKNQRANSLFSEIDGTVAEIEEEIKSLHILQIEAKTCHEIINDDIKDKKRAYKSQSKVTRTSRTIARRSSSFYRFLFFFTIIMLCIFQSIKFVYQNYALSRPHIM